jgi:hypothetical protein
MAACYRCGRPIAANEFKLRRKVKTGERLYRKYPNPQLSALHIHYGMRTVCDPCARAIDWEARRKELGQYLELAIALGLLFTLLAMRYLGWLF